MHVKFILDPERRLRQIVQCSQFFSKKVTPGKIVKLFDFNKFGLKKI